jgi:hypothetical protein
MISLSQLTIIGADESRHGALEANYFYAQSFMFLFTLSTINFIIFSRLKSPL